jgi:hypothetical protein
VLKRILIAVSLSVALLAAAPTPAVSQTSSNVPIVTFRGTYAGSTVYGQGVMVLYLGSSYISLSSSNQGNAPSTSPTFWQLITSAASTATPAGNNYSLQFNNGGVLAGSTFLGIPVVSNLGPPRTANYQDIVGFFGGGACSGLLSSNGSCVSAGATIVPYSCSGALALTLTPGDSIFVITATANCSITLATSAVTSIAQRGTVIIQPGGFTVTVPNSSSSLAWYSGTPPPISTSATTIFDLLFTGSAPTYGRY